MQHLIFVSTLVVAYGLERMNRGVSDWMRGNNEDGEFGLEFPFLATRGYDSVVWNRLYSREFEDMEDYQSYQASS